MQDWKELPSESPTLKFKRILVEKGTVHAEIITELILEMVGPIISDFATGIHSFQTESRNLSCKKSKARKLLETIITSTQGLH